MQLSISELSVVGGGWVGGLDKRTSWSDLHRVRQKEGEWRDFYNHQALNFTPPWAKNEPYGGTTENCAVAVLDSDVW